MQFALSVALASSVYWLLGSALLRRFHLHAAAALPFTSIYCAQMVLWFASYLVLPLNAGLDSIVGLSIPIGALVWTSAIAVFAIRRRALSESRSAVSYKGGFLITVGGMAAILKVALVYSSQSHLGALGLDTHQHIYWTRQILDANHVPLVERGTQILSLYPKGFHLMTALWTATGAFGPSGSWLKLMPFLQAFLPCIVFTELLWRRASKERSASGARTIFELGLAVSLLVIAFALTRMVYPSYDLGGTARFASGGALYFPYLLMVASVALEKPLLRRFSWLALPCTAVLLLAMNAILVVQLIVFVVPLMLVSNWLAATSEDQPKALLPGCAIAIAVTLPVAIAATDPWIVAQWVAPLGQTGDQFLDWFGILTPERAATLGLIATDELVAEARGAVQFASVTEIAKLFFTSLSSSSLGVFATGSSFPFSTTLASEFGRIALRFTVLGCAAGAVYSTSIRERQGDDRLGSKLGPSWATRLFAGLAIGSFVGGCAQIATFEFAKGLAVGRSYAFELLRDYCEIAPSHVGLVAETFIALAAINWLADVAPLGQRVNALVVHPAMLATLAGGIAMLPFALYGTTETVEADKSFWAPVSAQDLEDLRDIESHIGDAERVMAPANTWGIGDESWIVPQGPTAGLLPFTTKAFVFNSRLGASVYFNWKDLASFCRGTHEHRADFLARNDVRWFLLKGEGSSDEAFYRKVRVCKLRLGAMGVTYPPAFTAGSLSLYRIDPSSVTESTRERARERSKP